MFYNVVMPRYESPKRHLAPDDVFMTSFRG